MGARSLYTGMPSNKGSAATKKRYNNCIHKTFPTKITTTFPALVLMVNNILQWKS